MLWKEVHVLQHRGDNDKSNAQAHALDPKAQTLTGGWAPKIIQRNGADGGQADDGLPAHQETNPIDKEGAQENRVWGREQGANPQFLN